MTGYNTSNGPVDVVTDPLGNVYVTGNTGNYSTFPTSYFFQTIKYSTTGVQQWVNTFAGTTQHALSSGLVINGNGVVIVGSSSDTLSDGTNNGGRAVLLNLDLNSGNAIWTSYLNGPASTPYSGGTAVTNDLNGNIYIAGGMDNVADAGSTQVCMVAKYSASGSLQWYSTYDGQATYPIATALTLDPSNNVIVTGTAENSTSGFTEYHTVKFDNTGNQSWASIFSEGGFLKNDASSFLNNNIVADSAGNSYICGQVLNAAGTGPDFVTIKYSPSGAQLWTADFNSPTGDGFAEDLFVDKGAVYVTGEVGQNGVDFITTIKYPQNSRVVIPLDTMFKNLNAANIQTGYLYDQAFHFTNMNNYDGVFDTVSEFASWKQMYLETYNSAIAAPAIPSIDTIVSNIRKFNASNNNAVPLLIMNFQYNQIKEYARDSNWIQFINGKYYDGPGNHPSPYYTKTLFAAAPATDKISSSTITYAISPKFFLSGDGILPTTLQIDFGDGLGFRSVNWGDQITVNYSTGRAPISSPDLVTLKVHATFGSRTMATSSVLSTSNCITTYELDNPPWNYFPSPGNNYIWEFLASIPYLGSYGRGNAYVIYRDSVPPSEIGKFRKPIVFVEGVDFGYDHLPGRNGDLGFCEFMGGNKTDFGVLKDMPFLIDKMRALGYDIIILDFYDGADYIQRNGLLLVELLNRINASKLGSEENVVLGASMGGQVAKYALSYMEKNDLHHCTREYISFDSPQLGANIPLGLQWMIDFLAYNGPSQLNRSFQEQAEGKLNRTAAKQLLLEHYTHPGYPGTNSPNDAASLHTDFYNNISYPMNLRKVAVANGSGNATGQGYSPGDLKMKWTIPAPGCSVIIDAEVYAESGNNTLFKGRVVDNLGVLACGVAGAGCIPCYDNLSASSYVAGPAGLLALDNVPGGRRSSFDDAAKAINDPLTTNNILGHSWILYPAHIYNGGVHAFIPTISSLGVNTTNYFYNVSNNIPSTAPNPSLYAFDAYYAPPANQDHVFIDITQTGPKKFGYNTTPGGNAEWVLQEMLNNELPLVSHLFVGNPMGTSGVFNFGRIEESHHLPDLTIDNGGKLYVNANMLTDYGAVAKFIPPAGVAAPIAGSNYILETSDCASIITIANGGLMSLGDHNSPNNTATVIIHKNVLLEIQSGGKLVINDNSRLIIERGARISYDQGAEIQLLGDNAVLEIDGTLELGAGADFTFTYPGHNSGYVKFVGFNPCQSNFAVSICPNITTPSGGSCTVTLKGKNKNDKVLEVSNFVYPPDNLTLFTIDKGLVDGPGLLNLGCSIQLTNCTMHAPVKVYGQQNATINNCLFDGPTGTENMEACLFNFGYPLTISNSTFHGYHLNTIDKGVTLNNVNFYNNDIGWNAHNMSFPSVCNTVIGGGTPANANNSAIIYKGGGSAPLSLNECNLSYNGIDGIEMSGSPLNVKCGSISNNAIYGLLITNNSSLNMSTDPGFNAGEVNAINNGTTTGSGVTIHCEDANMLYLNNGENELLSAATYQTGGACRSSHPPAVCRPLDIDGTMDISYNPCSTNCGGPIILQANQNHWNVQTPNPITGISPVPLGEYNLNTDYDCIVPVVTGYSDLGPRQIILQDNNPRPLGACGLPVPCISCLPVTQGPLEYCPDCQLINTTSYTGVPLNLAVKRAINTIKKANAGASASGGGHNKDAVDLFYQILKVPISKPTPNEQFLINLAYQKMKEALGLAFMQSEILASDNAPILHASVLQVLEIQDALITSLIPCPPNTDRVNTGGGNPNVRAAILIDKAMTYNLADRRDMGIPILQQIILPDTSNLKPYVVQLECIMNLEQQVLSGVITREMFSDAMKNCTGQNARHMFAHHSNSGGGDSSSDDVLATEAVSVYPNPTQSELNIKITLPENSNTKGQTIKYAVRIIDVLGQVVYSGQMNYETVIDVSGLGKGIYVVDVLNESTLNRSEHRVMIK